MTQEQFEAAGVAFLEGLFAANATLAAVPYVVRPARSQETPPEDRSMVVVLCGEVINFREQLKEAMLECYVRSPADVETVSLESHGLLTAALEAAWASANYGAWSTEVTAANSGYAGANYYREGWSGGTEGTDWLPALRMKVGARVSA